MYSFGQKLKELRTKRGLTQDELADLLNEKFDAKINKGMISKWENDLVEPRLDVGRMLALIFNVSLDELLGIEPNKDDIQILAAHHEGEDWTEEELAEIERFKEFVRMKRKQKQQE
jgi:transcriptional regulator with XRE-family HTH domain